MGLTTTDVVRVLNPLEAQAVEMAITQGPLDSDKLLTIAIGRRNGGPLVIIGRGDRLVEIPFPTEEDE